MHFNSDIYKQLEFLDHLPLPTTRMNIWILLDSKTRAFNSNRRDADSTSTPVTHVHTAATLQPREQRGFVPEITTQTTN